MPSLIAYRKAISRETTIALRLPLDATQGQATAQELATLPTAAQWSCFQMA
jgi:hypothetical protein